MTRETMYSLKQDARADLLERLQWEVNDQKLEDYRDLDRGIEISDLISECADSMVPIYTYDLLELAESDLYLATDTPDCGPAFDGESTAISIIAANVYEALESDLYEYWQELEDSDEITFFDPEQAEREEFARDAALWFSKAYTWPPCYA